MDVHIVSDKLMSFTSNDNFWMNFYFLLRYYSIILQIFDNPFLGRYIGGHLQQSTLFFLGQVLFVQRLGSISSGDP